MEALAFHEKWPDTGTFDLMIADTNGVMRGMRIGRSNLEAVYDRGAAMSGAIFTTDIDGRYVTEAADHFSDPVDDCRCLPVAGTLAPSPYPNRGQFLTTMVSPSGAPFFADPRHILGAVVARFDQLGLRPIVEIEMQFHLMMRDDSSSHDPRPLAPPATAHAIDRLDAAAPHLNVLTTSCARLGTGIKTVMACDAPGQFRVRLAPPANPTAAADDAVLFRHAAISIAANHELIATFMAQPFPGATCSRLGVRLKVINDKGIDALTDATLRHPLGGLTECLPESLAIFAPSINAYRHIQPGVLGAVPLSWQDIRAAAIVVHPEPDGKTIIDHRLASAQANVGLVIAAILAGVHHGIAEGVQPPSALDAAPDDDDATPPATWRQALRCFDAGSILPRYFGAEYCRLYSKLKWSEQLSYDNRISPLEYDWYLHKA